MNTEIKTVRFWHLRYQWSNGVQIRVENRFIQMCGLISDRGTPANTCRINDLFRMWVSLFHNNNNNKNPLSSIVRLSQVEIPIQSSYFLLSSRKAFNDKEKKKRNIHTHCIFERIRKYKNIEKILTAVQKEAIRQAHRGMWVENTLQNSGSVSKVSSLLKKCNLSLYFILL